MGIVVVIVTLLLAVVVIIGLLAHVADIAEKLRYARRDSEGWESSYRQAMVDGDRARDALNQTERSLRDSARRVSVLEIELQIALSEQKTWQQKCQQLIDEITNNKPKPPIQQQFEFMSREPVEL